MDLDSAALVLAWAVIILLAFANAGLLRQIVYLRQLAEGSSTAVRPSIAGPLIGARAPQVSGLDPSDESPRVLLFASSDCGTCGEVMARLRELAESDREGDPAIVLFRSTAGDIETDGLRVLEDQARTFQDYGIETTPFAVATANGMVTHAQRIGSGRTMETFLAQVEELTTEI